MVSNVTVTFTFDDARFTTQYIRSTVFLGTSTLVLLLSSLRYCHYRLSTRSLSLSVLRFIFGCRFILLRWHVPFIRHVLSMTIYSSDTFSKMFQLHSTTNPFTRAEMRFDGKEIACIWRFQKLLIANVISVATSANLSYPWRRPTEAKIRVC